MPIPEECAYVAKPPAFTSHNRQFCRVTVYSAVCLLISVLATWLLNVFVPSEENNKQVLAQRAHAMRARVPAFTLTSEQLFDEYARGNGSGYDGKVIQASFQIENLATTWASPKCTIGYHRHRLSRPSPFRQGTEFSCDVILEDGSTLSRMRIGQDISIKGICHESGRGIALFDGVIVSR